MASRRGRSAGRRFSKNGATYLWVSDQSQSTVTTSFASFVICAGSDWERTATSGEQASVVRVVGRFGWVMDDATYTVATQQLGACIAVADEDAAAVDPLLPATLDDEKVMWSWYSLAVKNSTAGSSNVDYGIQIDINVKQRRRITNGQGVEMSVGGDLLSGTANTIRFGWMMRTLIKVN